MALVKQNAEYDEDEHDDDIEARDTQKQVMWLHIICFILLPIISVLLLTAIILILMLNRGPPPSLLVINETRTERYVIKQMMSDAWEAYVKFAWGGDELKPVTKKNQKNSDLGVTIVDALSTLYIMEMDDQFKKGRKWVNDNFDYGKSDGRTTISYYVADTLGAFLSVYHLTKNNDTMFKQQAIKMADEMTKIMFDESTGLTYKRIQPSTGQVMMNEMNTIASVGGMHLEFMDLYNTTENKAYKEKVQHIRDYLKNAKKKLHGLYPDKIETNTGNWGEPKISSFGSGGNRFYEYLLKSFLQSGDTDNQAKDMFVEAMQMVFDDMLKSKGGLHYLASVNYNTKSVTDAMEKDACNVGGMLALAASKLKEYSSKYMDVAKKLAHTCHESYIRSNTMLGPDLMSFSEDGLDNSLNNGPYHLVESGNILETYFIMWRLTKEEKYRDWGWEIAIALQWYCRIKSGGYTGLNNVNNLAYNGFDDLQSAEFLGKTLKYLYLLFTEDSVIPLEDWVFNAAGHPLPIHKET